jgi:hypothetical protein
MDAAIDRLASEGWQAEGTAEYGFVFICREGERRLLRLTERDPYDRAASRFLPFGQRDRAESRRRSFAFRASRPDRRAIA